MNWTTLLSERLHWSIAGPLFGVFVVLPWLLSAKPFGIVGVFGETLDRLRGEKNADTWRIWSGVGLIAGGLVAAALGAGTGQPFTSLSFGSMSEIMDAPWMLATLFAGGVSIGFGARAAGGCTMGHGLCGTSALSSASIASTLSFMGVAVGASHLLNWLFGGRL